MADAYFRIKHRPVATLTSCGPGSANLVMALANCISDSSAFLAITGNVPTQQFGRSPFQEINRLNQADFPSVLRPVVKRGYQAYRAEMLPLLLRQAMTTMLSGRPGPVNLDVPYNVFQEEAEVDLPPSSGATLGNRSAASSDDLRRAIELLANAKRPVIFVGHGVTLSEGGAELTEFARRRGIPVISSPNGMGCLDMGDPLSLGFIGRNGAFPANQAGRLADVVLAIGARFDDRSASSWIPGYSWNFPKSKLIHVDIDPNELGRNYVPELAINADARTFLRQLLDPAGWPKRTDDDTAQWREQIAEWRQQWEEFVRPHFTSDAVPIRPERVVRELAAALPDDAIISLDSGVHHNWFMQFWKPKRPQLMLNAWGFSAMGFGVSGILGAKLAAPDQPCISICGDGGFTMTPHVLCTAVEYDIPCVWVVWNNFAWAAIRDIQIGMFGGREIGTAFYQGKDRRPYNPDFVALARAHGVDSIKVTSPGDLGQALQHAVACNRPYLLDVHVDANVRPPATGTWQLPPTPYREPAFGSAIVV
jgi:acetolactate synthase-1/2/3 large subunit